MLTAFATYLGKFVFFIAVAKSGFLQQAKSLKRQKGENSATAE